MTKIPTAIAILIATSLFSWGAIITTENPEVGIGFGHTVSQSGEVTLVGAPSWSGMETHGGIAGAWHSTPDQGGEIQSDLMFFPSNLTPGGNFGMSASANGDLASFGSPGDNLTGKTAGAVYVFNGVSPESHESSEIAQLIPSSPSDFMDFGYSVSLSGTTALVGARGENNATGGAYLYRGIHDGTDTVTENAHLLGSNATSSSYFGHSVSLDGNTGLVGAPGQDDEVGAAYLFRGLDSATGDVYESAELVSSLGTHSLFGDSVGISGNMAVVGAPRESSIEHLAGAAFLYRGLDSASGTIEEDLILRPSDISESTRFGAAVGLSGTTAIVGASDDSSRIAGGGSAYVFLASYKSMNRATSPESSACDSLLETRFGSGETTQGLTLSLATSIPRTSKPSTAPGSQ